jgi:hypothetical protein
MVVSQAKFTRRTEHSVRRHAAHGPLGDREASRQYSAHGGERDEVAHGEVHRSTNDLERAVSRVDDNQSNAIGAFDGANLVHSRDHHVAQAFTDVFHAVDHETEVVQNHPEFVEGLWEFDKLLKPGK